MRFARRLNERVSRGEADGSGEVGRVREEGESFDSAICLGFDLSARIGSDRLDSSSAQAIVIFPRLSLPRVSFGHRVTRWRPNRRIFCLSRSLFSHLFPTIVTRCSAQATVTSRIKLGRRDNPISGAHPIEFPAITIRTNAPLNGNFTGFRGKNVIQFPSS